MPTTPTPDPGRTFEPSRARRIWRFCEPAVWLAACVAAVALGRPIVAIAFGVPAVVVGAISWSLRGEAVSIADGVLRHTTARRARSIELEGLSRVTYELVPARLPIPPRSLWLAGRGDRICLGHRRSWASGHWDEMLRELAPWVAGADVSRPASQLFSAVTACVAGLPDGRPGFVPAENRHARCPHPELCRPGSAPGSEATPGRVP